MVSSAHCIINGIELFILIKKVGSVVPQIDLGSQMSFLVWLCVWVCSSSHPLDTHRSQVRESFYEITNDFVFISLDYKKTCKK